MWLRCKGGKSVAFGLIYRQQGHAYHCASLNDQVANML
uniref:Uncharacterized protein n=1 Tax=Arundo donax TaxID=35708 RepID=A0A0A8ZUN3_ARUDO